MTDNSVSVPTLDELAEHFQKELSCEHLTVDGDGRHFYAILVSDRFNGLSKLARHQLVYQALGKRMGSVHALSIKTLTPQEWHSDPGTAH